MLLSIGESTRVLNRRLMDALLVPFVDNRSGEASVTVKREGSRDKNMQLFMLGENPLISDVIKDGCGASSRPAFPLERYRAR